MCGTSTKKAYHFAYLVCRKRKYISCIIETKMFFLKNEELQRQILIIDNDKKSEPIAKMFYNKLLRNSETER